MTESEDFVEALIARLIADTALGKTNAWRPQPDEENDVKRRMGPMAPSRPKRKQESAGGLTPEQFQTLATTFNEANRNERWLVLDALTVNLHCLCVEKAPDGSRVRTPGKWAMLPFYKGDQFELAEIKPNKGGTELLLRFKSWQVNDLARREAMEARNVEAIEISMTKAREAIPDINDVWQRQMGETYEESVQSLIAGPEMTAEGEIEPAPGPSGYEGDADYGSF